MEQQELIKKLISHYEYGIENLPEDDEDMNKFLIDMFLDIGICKCAKMKFDSIIDYVWILSKIPDDQFLFVCETPYFESYENAKKYLQIRLDILKQYPN